MLPARYGGDSWGTAGVNSEEGGDDVKSSCPLCSGLHTCYNGRYKEKQDREVERNSKTGPSSDCRLQLACTKLELLVIADQNAAVNAFPGLVHTARHTTGVGGARSRIANLLEASVEGEINNWGEVVTR